MHKVWVITVREIRSFFTSPIAYIVLILTVSVFNIFFFLIIEQNREATLRDVFAVMEFMFIFIIPIITMKSIAEERQEGTMEFLSTTPTTNTVIILGKYLGSLLFVWIIIAFTVVYYGIIEYFSSIDRNAVMTGYLGICLESALFVAVGLMCSSWTKNQVIAAITSYVIIFLLFFSLSFTHYTHGVMKEIIMTVSCITHFKNFSLGIISIADIVYYLSGILFSLAMARLSIENKIWR